MNDRPRSPYKGLAAFADSPLDALFFFGREAERESIVANLLATRLTVLFGPSGVGKSSLLHAGVAQALRRLESGAVVVHDAWADDPQAGLLASIRDAVPELGPTAGFADAAAAAAHASGELFLLLDQFEEYFLYHGPEGPLAEELPELVQRPGVRVSVLLALRDDALAELDAFAGRLPELFANMLRLERLDREAGRAAVLGPLDRYGELVGGAYRAEDELVETVLDEVAEGRVDFTGAAESGPVRGHVEAPFLQLVLERLWEEERQRGSHVLRLETFRSLGGAEPIVREHVEGALDRLDARQRDSAARVVRQLVTSSGAKVAHTATDLAEYAAIDEPALRPLLDTLLRERILRALDGKPERPPRYEIFHDVLAAPVLAWRVRHELERERREARRQRRRLRVLAAAAIAALLVVTAVAVFALVQRSSARTQAQHAHGRELAAEALAGIPSDPATSLALALHAASLAPGRETEDVLRSSLLATRELRVVRVGGDVVAAAFAPHGGRLLVVGSDGRIAVDDAGGRRLLAPARRGALTRAAWRADGRVFATGDASGTATLWDARDGRPLRRVETPAPVSVLAFDGRELLVGSGGHVRLVDGVRGPVRTIRVEGAVVAAALSPNGRLLAVAARKGGTITTTLRDGRTGRIRSSLPERGVDAVAFSADGRVLATASGDRTARLWDASTGRLLHRLRMHGRVDSVAFSRDGAQLVSASTDGTAAVWDVRSGGRRLLLVGATGAAEDAAFSPDGTEIAVGFTDRDARLYSSQDGRLLAALAGHADAVTSVAFDPTGAFLVTGSADGTARLWNARPSGELTTIDRRGATVDAGFAGADVLAVAGNEADLLTTSGLLRRRLRLPARIIAAVAQDGTVALVDAPGDVELAPLRGGARVLHGLGVAALGFGGGVFVGGSSDGVVREWSAHGRLVRSFRTGAAIAQVAAGPGVVAIRTAGGFVSIYSSAGRLRRTIRARSGDVAVSPDGAVVATTHAREAELWDAVDGRLLHRLRGHHALVTDAEFSPGGRLLVTASDDHDARIWDVADGRLVHVLRGHFFPVRSAAFGPDGRWVVTASQFSGGLWDAETGRLVLYLQGHTRPLTGAVFGPDGRWIATGSADGTLGVYRCDICRNLGGLEQAARERLSLVR